MKPNLVSAEQPSPVENHNDSYPLLQLAFRFWEAKVLLSAVRLGVFDALAVQCLDEGALAIRIGCHPRGVPDFLDSLVALGLLARAGGLYANTPIVSKYLDRAKPSYIGGLMELADARLYPVWGNLEEALRTGTPQNEARCEPDYYDNLSRDPTRLQVFLLGMTGLSMDSAVKIAQRFDWARYSTFADIGGGQGTLAVKLATAHPQLAGVTFDLPAVAPLFEEYVRSFSLGDRVRFCSGNFFEDALPNADVLVMGHVLHNWSVSQRKSLIQKAWIALPSGGVLLVYDAVKDEDRSQNLFALLMSLNMLLVTAEGSTYTSSECIEWMKEAGFRSCQSERLTGADSLIIAIK